MRHSFWLTILLLVSIAPIVSAEPNSRNIPKWKLEHLARVANAAKVCSTPVISENVNPHDLTTGFYSINVMSANDQAFIDIVDGEVVLNPDLQKGARAWLVSQVGAGLYDISSCYQGRPVCLSSASENKVRITECDELGYGDQTWWFKGYLVGKNAGGWFLGSDGIGQHQCFVKSDQNELIFKQCDDQQLGWNLTRTGKPKPTTELNQLVLEDFPNDADIINYQCDSGKQVEVYYGNRNHSQEEILVRYDNQLKRLNNIHSASGAKFGGVNLSWGWWNKGDQGAIYNSNNDVFIETCQQINPPLVRKNEQVWNAQQFEGGAAVADCSDCEEEMELLIRCQDNADYGEVTVWINADHAAERNQLVLEAIVGEQTFQYPFEATYLQMIGHHVAEFKIDKNDSILSALQYASEVSFKVPGDISVIGLNGSKSAIQTFTNYCGWTH